MTLNKPTIKGLVKTIVFLKEKDTTSATIDDLREHFKKSDPTVRKWLKTLESIGLITTEWEKIGGKGQAKMVPKLISSDAIQKDPKPKEVKQEEKETQQPIPEHKSDSDTNPANDDKKLIVIESLELTNEEKILDDFLNDNLFNKGFNEVLQALQEGKRIKASDLGSHCKVKKEKIKTLVLLLCKNINREARKKNQNTELPIKSVMIHHPGPDDFEKMEIEINPEIDESELPQVKKFEKPKKTIEQLCATPGLCDAQKKMLIELNKSGGSLDKKELQSRISLPADTFNQYIVYMEDLKVITIDKKQIHLNI